MLFDSKQGYYIQQPLKLHQSNPLRYWFFFVNSFKNQVIERGGWNRGCGGKARRVDKKIQ
jgi:hypothetical protein